jgi:murein DD-endopeptidase / murein LD-carboxypeptidase
MPAEDRIKAARSLIDTPFRFDGRTHNGLDCVGLIALLFDKRHNVADHYPLRTSRSEVWTRELDDILTRRNGTARAGDALLLTPSPLTFHLGLWTGASLIHADIRLRRVVETPGNPLWPIIGAWF